MPQPPFGEDRYTLGALRSRCGRGSHPGPPRFVSIARGNVRIYLPEHLGDAVPNALIHLYVTDIDAVSAEFGMPVDEEGLAGRECDIEDPDGNRLRIATRRPR